MPRELKRQRHQALDVASNILRATDNVWPVTKAQMNGVAQRAGYQIGVWKPSATTQGHGRHLAKTAPRRMLPANHRGSRK